MHICILYICKVRNIDRFFGLTITLFPFSWSCFIARITFAGICAMLVYTAMLASSVIVVTFIAIDRIGATTPTIVPPVGRGRIVTVAAFGFVAITA